jgi:hypothetical protein
MAPVPNVLYSQKDQVFLMFCTVRVYPLWVLVKSREYGVIWENTIFSPCCLGVVLGYTCTLVLPYILAVSKLTLFPTYTVYRMYIAGILNPLSPDTDYFLLYMIIHWCPIGLNQSLFTFFGIGASIFTFG